MKQVLLLIKTGQLQKVHTVHEQLMSHQMSMWQQG